MVSEAMMRLTRITRRHHVLTHPPTTKAHHTNTAVSGRLYKTGADTADSGITRATTSTAAAAAAAVAAAKCAVSYQLSNTSRRVGLRRARGYYSARRTAAADSDCTDFRRISIGAVDARCNARIGTRKSQAPDRQ